MILRILFAFLTILSGVTAYANVGFHSGQQTQAAAAWWKRHTPIQLFLSSPPFNGPRSPEQIAAWESIPLVKINKPCFGDIVITAAQAVQESGEPVQYGVSDFVLGKLSKVGPLVRELQSRNLGTIAARIQTFVTDIQANKMTSFEEWEAFLNRHHLPRVMNLNFDHYLKNFDFDNQLTPELLAEINDFEIIDKDGKSVALKHECIRWLTKATFGPIGCFADVVNLMEVKDELPSILMMDAEGDDKGVLSILRKRHEEKGTALKVVVQLPTDPRADGIAEYYASLGYEILRDPESRNIDALLSIFDALTSLKEGDSLKQLSPLLASRARLGEYF